MGKCTINFDSIEIQNKKSDSDHADNDWLSIVFYANEGEVYRDTISLRNLGGSQVINSGDVITPFQAWCDCDDKSFVTAVYAITNFGSSDWDDQAEAATKVTGEIAKACADIYLQAAKLVLEAASADFGGQVGAGIAQLIAPFYDLLEKKIVELVGITFDKVIAPIVAAIAGEVANLLGHPDCNGEVMRDVATFWPGVVNDESYSKTYEGSQKNSYCGMAPHTKIDLRKYRELDLFVGEFGPVIQPDQNELAIRELLQRARVSVQEGLVGGFANFYYASYGPRNVGQTIFLRHRCAELHNVDSLLLGEPDQNDFAEMMRAANDYALRHGFVGGFPTFLADQEVSISRSENPMSRLATVTGADEGRRSRLNAPRQLPWSNTNLRLQVDQRIICGIVVIKKGFGERRDVLRLLLGNPPLNNIGARFQRAQDYAKANGVVGAFPNFYQTGSGLTQMCGTILVSKAAGVRRDVLQSWGPN